MPAEWQATNPTGGLWVMRRHGSVRRMLVCIDRPARRRCGWLGRPAGYEDSRVVRGVSFPTAFPHPSSGDRPPATRRASAALTGRNAAANDPPDRRVLPVHRPGHRPTRCRPSSRTPPVCLGGVQRRAGGSGPHRGRRSRRTRAPGSARCEELRPPAQLPIRPCRFRAGELVKMGHMAARLHEQIAEEPAAGCVRRAVENEHVLVPPTSGPPTGEPSPRCFAQIGQSSLAPSTSAMPGNYRPDGCNAARPCEPRRHSFATSSPPKTSSVSSLKERGRVNRGC